MKRNTFLSTCLIGTLFASVASAAFPPTPSTWLNGNQMDLNALKGKIVVLQFYEET